MVQRTSALRSLSKAVSLAFAKAALPNDALSGAIEHTDLPWQSPPLFTHLELHGIPLQEYFADPLVVNHDAFISFWQQTMRSLRQTPSMIVSDGTYDGLSAAMPGVRNGVRALRFTPPAGHPDDMDPRAGVLFSMEAAYTAYLSLAAVDWVTDENNFFVHLQDGTLVGVRDGQPLAGAEYWHFDARGMVLELAAQMRGTVTYDCWYDSIAFARSLLHTHAAKFGDEFEAVDLAIQALRVLSAGRQCPDLVHEMRAVPKNYLKATEQYRVLKSAIGVLDQPVSDRAKLLTLHAELVPFVLKATTFRTQIYAGPPFPYNVEPHRMERVRILLEEKLRELERKA